MDAERREAAGRAGRRVRAVIKTPTRRWPARRSRLQPGCSPAGPFSWFAGRVRGECSLLPRFARCAAEITGSCVGHRVNRVEVADGVAVVLPLLLRGSRAGTTRRSRGIRGPTGSCASAARSSEVTVARKSRTMATWPARTSSTSAYDGVTVAKTDMSLPSVSYSALGWPMGWNGCSMPRIARPSHVSVAMTRCRSVCANDHSPSTETSTVPAGIAATRSRVAAHVRSSAAQAARRPSGSAARRPARPGKRRLSSASTSGITSTPLTRKEVSPPEKKRCVDVRPRTSTARITTPERSALRTGRHAGSRRRTPLPAGRQTGEGCHDFSFPSAAPPLAHVSPFRQARDGIVLNTRHTCPPRRGKRGARSCLNGGDREVPRPRVLRLDHLHDQALCDLEGASLARQAPTADRHPTTSFLGQWRSANEC